MPDLLKTEIERPRTQMDLRSWVNEIDSAFEATEEGIKAARLNKGLNVKVFYEEVWPLALFADAFYAGRTDVLFQNIIGNQSFDALIIDASSQQIIEYLQITQSFDGYQTHLQMLHLNQHGWAPGTGPPLRKSPRSQHVPETTLLTTDFDDGLQAEMENILTAVQMKSTMRYESKTSLIVEFEDQYISRAVEALNRFARTRLLPILTTFEKLYLVSERHHLSFQCRVGQR